jgi:hypothetical protein
MFKVFPVAFDAENCSTEKSSIYSVIVHELLGELGLSLPYSHTPT